MDEIEIVVRDKASGIEARIIEDDEGRTEYVCSCGTRDTDRGHFQDTVEAAGLHLMRHAPGGWLDTGSGPGYAA